MKKSTFIFFILFIYNGFLFCQTTKDSLGGKYTFSHFSESFSAEESWQIHKAAYIKQLKKQNLTASQIEKKVTAYEKQKKEFIEKINKQRKLAEIQRVKAEKLREQADIQRQQAEELIEQADIHRLQAEELRGQADIQRQKAEEQRKQADILREQAEEQRRKNQTQHQNVAEKRKQVDLLLQQADVLFQKTDVLFKEVDVQFKKSDEQRKQADILFQKAEEQIKKAEEERNNFEIIISKNITLTSQLTKVKTVSIKVDIRKTLRFNIDCNISSGTATIEIFNPLGERIGKLSLDHITKLNQTEQEELSKSTTASLNKIIPNAAIGDWEIKFTTKKAEGDIKISVAHSIKSDMND